MASLERMASKEFLAKGNDRLASALLKRARPSSLWRPARSLAFLTPYSLMSSPVMRQPTVRATNRAGPPEPLPTSRTCDDGFTFNRRINCRSSSAVIQLLWPRSSPYVSARTSACTRAEKLSYDVL